MMAETPCGLCAVSWVRHGAGDGGSPYLAHLIARFGFEAYGRYWRLVELLMAEPSHQIGGDSGAAFSLATFGLGFADDGEAASFMESLCALSLLGRIDGGGYRSPVVDDAIASLERNRERGRKGGLKAAANRRAARDGGRV